MTSESVNADEGDDSGDFYVEPWTVRQVDDSLIVADETPASEYYVSALIGLAVGAIVVILMRWLVPDFAWISYGIGALLFARLVKLVFNGPHRPQRFEFLRESEAIVQNGSRLGAFTDLSAIEIIESRTWDEGAVPVRMEHLRYELQLRFTDNLIPLGNYATKFAAERLGNAIASYVGKPLIHR